MGANLRSISSRVEGLIGNFIVERLAGRVVLVWENDRGLRTVVKT